MAFKIGNVALSDIVVNDENGNPIDIREVNVKKNNVITKVWGKRSVTVTVNYPQYISSVIVTYNDAGGYSKSTTISSTTTFSDVGYNESVTITATSATDTAQWHYSTTGSGTYSSSTSSITVTGYREVRKYTVYLTGTYTTFYYYDEGTEVTETYILNVPYGTIITQYDTTTIKVGSDDHYIKSFDPTTEYTYSNTHFTSSFPINITGDTTIYAESTRSDRYYDVTVGFKYNDTVVASQTLSVKYNTRVISGNYYPANSYSYTNTYAYTFTSGTSNSIYVKGSGYSVYTVYTSCSYKFTCSIDIPNHIGAIWYKWGDYSSNSWNMTKTGTTISRTKTGYPGSGSYSVDYFAVGTVSGSTVYYLKTKSCPLPSSCGNKTVYSSITIGSSDFTISQRTLSESASNAAWYFLENIQIKNTYQAATLALSMNKDSDNTNTAMRNEFRNMGTFTSSGDYNDPFIDDPLIGGIMLTGDYCQYMLPILSSLYTDTTFSYEQLNGASITYDGNYYTTMYGIHIKATPTEYYDEETGMYYYEGQNWDLYLLWHHASTYNIRVVVASGATAAHTQPTRLINVYTYVQNS